MEFALNIYDEEKKVEKTYRTNDFMLMMGTAEDLINIIELDKFNGKMTREEEILETVKIVWKCFPLFKPILKDIFPGLTDEECRRVNLLEVGGLIYNVIGYITANFMSAVPSDTKKN